MKKILKGIVFGTVIGFVAGIIALTIMLKIGNDYLPGDKLLTYSSYSFGYPFLFSGGFGRHLGLCSEMNCLIIYFFGGILFYMIIGGLIGFLIIKKKK